MPLRNKFMLFVALSLVVLVVGVTIVSVLFWDRLDPNQRAVISEILKERFAYVFLALFLGVGGIVLAIDALLHYYLIPMHRLEEETAVIATVNPAHRINIEGGKEVLRLVDTINRIAVRLEEAETRERTHVEQAKARIEEERNILAAVMAELTDGVLVCNTEGRILLYNAKARRLLSDEENGEGKPSTDQGLVGLGRSVFGVVDRNLVIHSLDTLNRRVRRGEGRLVHSFAVSVGGGRLLRVQMVPVLHELKEMRGFILVLADITERVETECKRDYLLQTLTEGLRRSLAGIRAAIEAMIEYPNMEDEQERSFKQVILQESMALSDHVDQVAGEQACQFRTGWPLDEMAGTDLLTAIKHKCGQVLGLKLDAAPGGRDVYLRVDSYALVLAFLFVLNEIKGRKLGEEFFCRLGSEGRFVNVDLCWKGSALPLETLKHWLGRTLSLTGEELPLRLGEVLERHNAEIWPQRDDAADVSCLRFLFPSAPFPDFSESQGEHFHVASRPEFYDFDLFNQPGQRPEVDDVPLGELTYTVFDTETTGLDASGGDEIISIGAVRLLNGRLLRSEVFDRLVDPRRPVPEASIKVHGILPEMLEGQPGIEEVLPAFSRFCENTVLAAHNAAFDMRLLQVNEARTGVKFDNAVVDTLLLSAVAHPNQKDHTIEGVAGRMGIRVTGRHTALGDALVTAEILLKLIPLLAQRGIVTLKDARQASKKTLYARLKY